MWKSREDIIKDLASLNDFSGPENLEPYKMIFSRGRGSNVKEKKEVPEKLIDSRTGEVIDIDDTPLNPEDRFYRTKGRGKLLCSFSSTRHQLQEQLRLARPMGSGDEAIESYCRRKRPTETSTSTSDSEPYVETQRLSNTDSNASLNIPRVKGCRNSNLQSNALINNLLLKTKDLNDSVANNDNNGLQNEKGSFSQCLKNNQSSFIGKNNEKTCSKLTASSFDIKDEDFPSLKSRIIKPF